MKTGAHRWLGAAVLLLSCAVALAQDEPDKPVEQPLAKDLREEVQHIGVTVSDMHGRRETRQIPITVFRPPGDGPFPLVILNHGRAVSAQRELPSRFRYEHAARYLVSKGFVVMVPTRVGYGETFGDFDPETHGACSSRQLEPMAMAASDQVLATLAFAKGLPFVDTTRWLVAGQSVGGLTAVFTVARRPPGLVGGINFAGGVGGDPARGRPGDPCRPEQIAQLWRARASAAAVPMLWLYWENDLYWGPDNPKRWQKAWVEGGGKAELHTLAAAGADGHVGISIDMDHWVPLAERFLATLGFRTPGVIARPAASAYAAIDDADKVPASAMGRGEGYRRFLAARAPRAFAASSRGAWGWATGDWALGRALGNCERSGAVCRLYAVDDEVVWTRAP